MVEAGGRHFRLVTLQVDDHLFIRQPQLVGHFRDAVTAAGVVTSGHEALGTKIPRHRSDALVIGRDQYSIGVRGLGRLPHALDHGTPGDIRQDLVR